MKKMTLSEKKEFAAVDWFRIIASVLVLAAHTHPFASLNSNFSFAFDYALCRITVPFFFLTTGFFMYHKLDDKERVTAYIKRILGLYLLYTSIYIPVNIIDYIHSGKSPAECVLSYVRNFLLLGVIPPLWYFIGTAFAVYLLHLAITKTRLGERGILIISLVLYIAGVLLNTYKEPFLKIPLLGDALELYFYIFETTRNGLFYGILFIFLGGMIRKYGAKIKSSPLYPMLSALFLACMYFELTWAKKTFGGDECDMLFFTAPAALFLFLTLAMIRMPSGSAANGLFLRKASVIVFGLHPFVSFWLEYPMKYFGIENPLVMFLSSLIVLLALSAAIIKLSERFAFLKKLY